MVYLQYLDSFFALNIFLFIAEFCANASTNILVIFVLIEKINSLWHLQTSEKAGLTFIILAQIQ